MTIKILCCILTFGLLGCSTTPVSADGIQIKDVRGDVPGFKREYKVAISPNVSMKISANSYNSGTRYFQGELDQSGGRWVLFDPESPADKILDRELLPIIQRFCTQILALDRAFVKSAPREYMDESGVIWRRAN